MFLMHCWGDAKRVRTTYQPGLHPITLDARIQAGRSRPVIWLDPGIVPSSAVASTYLARGTVLGYAEVEAQTQDFNNHWSGTIKIMAEPR